MLDIDPPVEGGKFTLRYKYRFYPTEAQKKLIISTFGCCRKVWNHLFDKSVKDYKNYELLGGPKPGVSGYDFHKRLTLLKQQPEFSYLNEVSNVALQQSLAHLGRAYSNFFNPKLDAKFPQFKSKHGHQAFTLTKSGFTLKEGKVTIAKCDTPLKVNWSRQLPSEPSSCTIMMTPTGKFFISFVCVAHPKKTDGHKFTGVDAGITNLAIFSDGTTIPNPRHYVKHQKKLKRLQQRLAKKKEGSKNREKARIKVAQLHEKMANARLDYAHKLTTSLIRDNQAVGIETLLVKRMVKNHCLAKHIMDAAWGMVRDQLKYKARHSQHCSVVLADPYYPSTQKCSGCDAIPVNKIKLGVTSWTCASCGDTHDRDHNAAKNLAYLAYTTYYTAKDAGKLAGVLLALKYTPTKG